MKIAERRFFVFEKEAPIIFTEFMGCSTLVSRRLQFLKKRRLRLKEKGRKFRILEEV